MWALSLRSFFYRLCITVSRLIVIVRLHRLLKSPKFSVLSLCISHWMFLYDCLSCLSLFPTPSFLMLFLSLRMFDVGPDKS